VARALARLKLKYAVLTSVTRDDLADGGASHWAQTVRAVRQACPDLVVEALTPDFGGRAESLDKVLEAGPHVLAHNLETVRRLSPLIRPQAGYEPSLSLLQRASDAGFVTKSGLMLGMGETDAEAMEAARDLRSAGVSILTLGQYLQPSRAQVPVDRYVEPELFDRLGLEAKALGFAHVESGPLVRSSYHADAQAAQVKLSLES
jgi:lipoic acid synthetase